MMFLSDGRHGLGEHTINTELDSYRIVPGFDMNIARSPLQRGKNSCIYEANDRADVPRSRGQLVNRDGLVRCCFIIANHV